MSAIFEASSAANILVDRTRSCPRQLDHEANNATVGEIGNEFSLKYANEL